MFDQSQAILLPNAAHFIFACDIHRAQALARRGCAYLMAYLNAIGGVQVL
jgi:hypothetical protein